MLWAVLLAQLQQKRGRDRALLHELNPRGQKMNAYELIS